MRRVHPLLWLQTGLALVLLMSLAVTARADEKAQRIVSVGGAVTEIVYALGEEDRLVARDTTSNHPPAALDLPDVGYIRRLSPEGLMSVNPDLIIAEEGAGPPEAVEVLEQAAIPLVEIPGGYTGAAVSAKINAVAAALGVPEKGTDLARKIDAQIKAAGAVAQTGEKTRVLFILSMAGGRIIVGGANTAADGIITLAGGENVMGDVEGWKQTTDEAILTANPDVIVMMDREVADEGANMGALNDELFSHTAIAATTAGQNRAVVRLDGMMMLGFSVRTAEGITKLSEALAAAGD
ncbi:heme/hemin ABC transporter substrate-binding protein [Rhodalgimonas zhirmunskyi]|uniref:ABC transporter substrate-binding protein n=1 Tax=Rhodalgimonas zhirmunskyi TaxID=2964767 RepID=A0AAJ1UB89_9RHOB|nr:ABC transporter substrate-binding protein [Rhodoalgimonas zhirmunskyi]MDQ2093386.1 ABC transporter substrate-binding protein [Rhodoalgimonas zhirmunskyi]